MGIADTLRINGGAVETHHFFLRAPNEVSLALLCGITVESFGTREHFGFEETPQTKIREVLTHMGCSRKQKQVLGGPRQLPSAVTCANAGKRLRQAVAVGLANPEVGLAVSRELVRFIEDDEIVGNHGRLLQPSEHSFPRQGVNRNDKQITLLADERVANSSVAARNDAESQAEQHAKFFLPIANQTRWRHDQNATCNSAGENLSYVKPSHDRFSSTCVVSEQES